MTSIVPDRCQSGTLTLRVQTGGLCSSRFKNGALWELPWRIDHGFVPSRRGMVCVQKVLNISYEDVSTLRSSLRNLYIGESKRGSCKGKKTRR